MERSSTRIPSLDGLRTISIALVIIGHFLQVVGMGEFSNVGPLGVRVFFVISGFLITGILVKEVEKTSTIDLLKFYFRRSMRIFPPYYFYLLALLLMGIFGSTLIDFQSLFWSALYATDYIAPKGWLLGHTWSLAVEEQFYLLMPFVLLLFGVVRSKRILIYIILLSPLIRLADYSIFGDDYVWAFMGFHTQVDALAVGCMLALYQNKLEQSRVYVRSLTKWTFGLLPLAILIINLQEDHPKFYYSVGISAMNVMIALCINWCVVNHRSTLGRLLNSPPLVKLGVMSYSIYLWQQPFFDPHSIMWFTSTPFNFIGLAVMALFSYYVVEKYSLKLRHRWEPRLFKKEDVSNETRPLGTEIGQPAASV